MIYFLSVIKCYHADVSTAKLPEKVDILVAEWMGYALFYENGLQHILEAREKFLVGTRIFDYRCFSSSCNYYKL